MVSNLQNPNKFVQVGDTDKQMQMCEWFSNKLNENINFTNDFMLLKGVNREFNRQNVRY